jgi:hypothetical protein
VVGQGCDLAPEDAVADDRVEKHQREDEQALSPEHERKTRLRRRRFVGYQVAGARSRPRAGARSKAAGSAQ